jgi:hypothetical protein
VRRTSEGWLARLGWRALVAARPGDRAVGRVGRPRWLSGPRPGRERAGWRACTASVVGRPPAQLRRRALVVGVGQRVLERAGVDSDEIRKYLDRLGYESTGQILPVANEVYRLRA